MADVIRLRAAADAPCVYVRHRWPSAPAGRRTSGQWTDELSMAARDGREALLKPRSQSFEVFLRCGSTPVCTRICRTMCRLLSARAGRGARGSPGFPSPARLATSRADALFRSQPETGDGMLHRSQRVAEGPELRSDVPSACWSRSSSRSPRTQREQVPSA